MSECVNVCVRADLEKADLHLHKIKAFVEANFIPLFFCSFVLLFLQLKFNPEFIKSLFAHLRVVFCQ